MVELVQDVTALSALKETVRTVPTFLYSSKAGAGTSISSFECHPRLYISIPSIIKACALNYGFCGTLSREEK